MRSNSTVVMTESFRRIATLLLNETMHGDRGRSAFLKEKQHRQGTLITSSNYVEALINLYE
jgi:hypothetical protein